MSNLFCDQKVGGVLYSIEIVSVFFSVRSYWSGFFAAIVGALFWRLLTVWFLLEDNITHLFKTDFRVEYPYETLELLSFAVLGALCGVSAFIFVTVQRQIVLFNRRQTAFHIILQKYPLIYPALVTIIISLISFPQTLGQYYGSWLSSGTQAFHQPMGRIRYLPLLIVPQNNQFISCSVTTPGVRSQTKSIQIQ